MSAVLTLSESVGQTGRLVMRGVSWLTYETLLADYQDQPLPRLTYNDGVLEINLALSFAHEGTSDSLRELAYALADELRNDAKCYGSATLKAKNSRKGAEPDSSFYFDDKAAAVAGVKKVDLAVHPAPDLVIEIDVTHPAVAKFPVYAALGIAEIWHWEDERAAIHVLHGETYAQTDASAVLPGVTAEIVTRFAHENRTLTRSAWLRNIRAWAQTMRMQ